jgi:acetyl esterase
MALDPQMQQLLEETKALRLPPIYDIPISEARRRVLKMVNYIGMFYDGVETIDVLTRGEGQSVPCRIYRLSNPELAPAVLFYHGGGWVTGCLETHDYVCRTLVNQSSCAIVAVDYRLAPEHPYPKPLEDAWSAATWVARHAEQLGLDPARIGVMGDSAGGTLAAAVSQMARDRRELDLVCQVLIYPALEHWSAGMKSYQLYGAEYPLTSEMMAWFWKQYVPNEVHWNDPLAFPLKSSGINGLPPTLVVTAEYDVLRDEAEVYAQKLQTAGVDVRLSRYNGMLHGFLMHFPILEKGQAAMAEVASFLRERLVKARFRGHGQGS